MSSMEKRGSQGRSTYDLLSWSDTPDASQARAPVRVSDTNNSTGFTSANDQSSFLPVSRPAIRILQPAGVSQISFGGDGAAFPKKGSSRTEGAKQRELSGSQETFEDQPRRQMSNAKAKEMSGSNIFAEYSYQGEPTYDRRRVNNQKAAELSGNGIFNKDGRGAPAERSVSDAKRREMTGSDIFSEEKLAPPPQQSSSRIRKPPDVVARIQQFSGSNPVQPDEEASAECVANPKRMSDKHISGTKIKEISGNYDLLNAQDVVGTNNKQASSGTADESSAAATTATYDTVDDKKSEKLHSDAKRQEIAGNYDLLSYAPNRHDNADYIKYTREKPASNAKLRELSGSYVFGDCYTATT